MSSSSRQVALTFYRNCLWCHRPIKMVSTVNLHHLRRNSSSRIICGPSILKGNKLLKTRLSALLHQSSSCNSKWMPSNSTGVTTCKISFNRLLWLKTTQATSSNLLNLILHHRMCLMHNSWLTIIWGRFKVVSGKSSLLKLPIPPRQWTFSNPSEIWMLLTRWKTPKILNSYWDRQIQFAQISSLTLNLPHRRSILINSRLSTTRDNKKHNRRATKAQRNNIITDLRTMSSHHRERTTSDPSKVTERTRVHRAPQTRAPQAAAARDAISNKPATIATLLILTINTIMRAQ